MKPLHLRNRVQTDGNPASVHRYAEADRRTGGLGGTAVRAYTGRDIYLSVPSPTGGPHYGAVPV